MIGRSAVNSFIIVLKAQPVQIRLSLRSSGFKGPITLLSVAPRIPRFLRSLAASPKKYPRSTGCVDNALRGLVFLGTWSQAFLVAAVKGHACARQSAAGINHLKDSNACHQRKRFHFSRELCMSGMRKREIHLAVRPTGPVAIRQSRSTGGREVPLWCSREEGEGRRDYARCLLAMREKIPAP